LISGGSIRASGSGASGIGGGSSGIVRTLRIVGGSILIDSGTIGVGGINSAVLGNLTIGSPHIDCGPIRSNTCLRSSSVTFENGSFSAVTGAGKLFEVDTVKFSEFSELYVIYIGQSEREAFRGLPLIHIESLRFDCNITYEVTVSGADSTNLDFHRTVSFDSIIGRGFGISVPSIGNYTIRYKYNSTDASSYGYLTHDGLTAFSAFDQDDTFYENVAVISEASRCNPLPTNPFTHSSTFSSQVDSDSLSTLNLYIDESRGPEAGTKDKDKDKGNSVMIGVVTGAVLFVFILAGVIILILRHLRQSDNSHDRDDDIGERRSETVTIENALVGDDGKSDDEFVTGVEVRHPTAAAYSLNGLQSATGTLYV
jgi:hypothetical protein